MRNFLGRRRGRDRGAALVEFAMLMPLLILVVMGIVDFGWAFAQNLDVRHGAREASRLVAVDEFVLVTACDRMSVSTGVQIELSGVANGVGGEATAEVTSNLVILSGFFDGWLPATISSEVKVRIEQPPSWVDGVQICP